MNAHTKLPIIIGRTKRKQPLLDAHGMIFYRMVKITDSDKEAIKGKINIVEYLEKRGHNLVPSGAMSFKMLCPVHNERSPSFNVSEEYRSFHCFGCGISGDIISLVMELDNLSFVAAVQELAAEAGVHLSDKEEDPLATKRIKLRKMMNEARQWYRQNFIALPESHPGKLNFSARNLLDQAMKDETVGWAPSGGLTNYLTQKKYSKEDMLDAGLLKRNDDGSYRESFRSRVTWSLEDAQGNTLGFSARHIMENDKGPKYLNSPQTILYNKSKTLLGLSAAKKEIITKQKVYIVEGQTDVMAMNAAGYQNTVASCGTAFGNQHAQLLMQLSKRGRGTDRFELVFCFDGDAAGLKAARKVFDENKDLHLHSSIVTLITPEAEPTDPCDYRKDFGDEALRNLVDLSKVNIVEFILLQEKKSWNIMTPEGQSHFINSARSILQLITDPIQNSSYVRKIAGWTGIPVDELTKLMSNPQRNINPNAQQQVNSPHIVTPPVRQSPSTQPRQVKQAQQQPQGNGDPEYAPYDDSFEPPSDDDYYDDEYAVNEAFNADVSHGAPEQLNLPDRNAVENPNAMELKMLSLVVKYPTEMLSIMGSMGVNIDFFLTSKSLTSEIMNAILGGNLSGLIASNPTVSSFIYQSYDLGETSEAQNAAMRKIVKSFMRYAHAAKINELNARIGESLYDSNMDPVEMMNTMVQEQNLINEKFLPKD